MQSELHTLNKLIELILSPRKLKEKLVVEGLNQQLESTILSFRESIRSQLLFIQNELTSQYSKKITNFMLFPIIANIDEKCKTLLTKNNNEIKWDALQLEFFQRVDGGEYVFEILDEVISNTIYPKISYELLIVILQENFLGKYYHNPNHAERHQYIKKLKDILNDLNKNISISNCSLYKKNQIIKNNRRSRKILIGIITIAFILPLSIYIFT